MSTIRYITHSDGHVTINRTAKVTGKGPPYLKIGVEPPEGHQDRRKVRYQRQVAEKWASAHEYRRTVAR